MASVNELRKHVFDDALALAASTGMLAPIANVSLEDRARVDPLSFIRRQLVALLVLTHANA